MVLSTLLYRRLENFNSYGEEAGGSRDVVVEKDNEDPLDGKRQDVCQIREFREIREKSGKNQGNACRLKNIRENVEID